MSDSLESKTLALIHIARILFENTDSDHKMTQAEIIEKLEKEYDITIERKTVARHLDALRHIPYIDSEAVITSPKGSWWDETKRTFSDSELRYLIDSVQFSKHLSVHDAEKLMEKLRKIGSTTMRDRTRFAANSVKGRAINAEVFDVIDRINQAIEYKKKISFVYSHYDYRKRLVPSDDKIVVSPLRLVPHNDHYYLVAKRENSTGLDFYRVERMSDVYGVDDKNAESIKIEEVDKYLSAHPYLSEGATEHCEILLSAAKLDDFVDAFGLDFSLTHRTETLYDITLQANPNDLYLWAVQNCVFVEVLHPYSVRSRLRNVSALLKVKYNQTAKDSYDSAIEKAYIDGELVLEHIDIREQSKHKELTGCSIVTLNDVRAFDLNFLQNFKHLRRLTIKSTPVGNLNILHDLPFLRTVALVDTGIRDLRFLKTLPDLAVVYLIDNKNITDYSVLYELNLSVLVIDKSVNVDMDRINARRKIIDDAKKIHVGGVFPQIRPSARLLTAIFKGYSDFSINEMPPVYTEANDNRFYDYLRSVLSEEDYEFIVDRYERIILNSGKRDYRKMTRLETEKETNRILNILREPTNLNMILQIYFA